VNLVGVKLVVSVQSTVPLFSALNNPTSALHHYFSPDVEPLQTELTVYEARGIPRDLSRLWNRVEAEEAENSGRERMEGAVDVRRKEVGFAEELEEVDLWFSALNRPCEYVDENRSCVYLSITHFWYSLQHY
jgi:hypothetical protein